MMHPNQGMVPPPQIDQQMQPQQPPPMQPLQPWAMVGPQPPQYHQPPMPPPMWTQQPSQIPPPQQMGFQGQPPQVQYQGPAAVPAASPQPGSADEIRTLWIGDLQYWMEETYLHSCFAGTGEVVSTKIIRNRQTGISEGYGFIEFINRAAAERALQTFNGQPMPNAEQVFRLNWASYGAGERKSEETSDFTIFVGDLAADVTDYMLQETFRSHYTSVKGAKVVMDRVTGRSKGYGFVRFGDVNEQTRAMTEMNGVFCSTRPMRIGPAATKKPSTASYPATQTTQTDGDPSNTTIFVGALDPSVNDELLRQVFGQYGELISVKIPVGKRCGFVQFASRACAEEAMLMLNGAQLGGQSVRLSWGRKPGQQEASQWGGQYYGYGQGYEAAGTYGYAAPPDPNAPTAAAAAYGAYQAYPSYPGYAPQMQPSQQ
ncbi:polyadenylate-binding protein RBP45-like [Wolffia australiana]